MEWQPIETAPKDGAEFLGYWPAFGEGRNWQIARTWFCAPDQTWETPTDSISDGDPDAPTHWMPLPQPPQEAKP